MLDIKDLLNGLTIPVKVAADTKEAERILETLRDAHMAMAQIADDALNKIKQPEEVVEMLTHCPDHGVELTLKADEPTRIVKYCTICSREWAFPK
jgi:predicted small metal-binding protein